MRHTISVLVENTFGVLARVTGMISGRGFNIDSLNVAPTHDASLSRITIVLKGDEAALGLCTKQLESWSTSSTSPISAMAKRSPVSWS